MPLHIEIVEQTNTARGNSRGSVGHSGGSRSERDVAGLVVDPGHCCAPYDRGDYFYRQAVEARIVESIGGRVYGPYTGRHFARRTSSTWSRLPRPTTAGCMRRCRDETAVRVGPAEPDGGEPGVNQHEKRGKGAGEWLPQRNRCWFAARVVAVKRKYGLTVDRREARALEAVLAGCASIRMVMDGGPGAAPGRRRRGRMRARAMPFAGGYILPAQKEVDYFSQLLELAIAA